MTAAATTTAPATGPVTKLFRVGFIGSGGISRTQMSYLKKIEDVEITAAADVSEGALQKAREMYNIPRTYSDYKEMLAKETDIDAVSVCTPNGLHAENTIAALEAGKHVMVEKPLAMNAKEGQRMVDAAKRAGKELVIGFQYRFAAPSQMIHQQIQDGEFGKIMYVRCQALRRRGIPNWGVFGRKELQGGGPMIDIGVHCLEMAHFMIGSPKPITATGNTWTFLGHTESKIQSMWPNWDYKTYNVEDMAVGMIRFDNGVMLTIEASFVAHIEKDIWNCQIMGEKGGASWDPLQIYKDHGNYMMNMTPGYTPKIDHFEAKMRHFVEVCQGKRANESSGEQGLMVQKMLDGVYQSSESGREVNIE
jgi:predicted dehydrogenase